MAQFHFSLEKVLRWRSLQLAREQALLERLVQEQVRIQMLNAALGDEKSKLKASIGTLHDLRGDDLRAVTAYGLKLKRQAESLTQVSARCERDLTAQKKKYNEAKRRLRLLEELRERRLTVWRYEQAQELEALAAESYLANWNRS